MTFLSSNHLLKESRGASIPKNILMKGWLAYRFFKLPQFLSFHPGVTHIEGWAAKNVPYPWIQDTRNTGNITWILGWNFTCCQIPNTWLCKIPYNMKDIIVKLNIYFKWKIFACYKKFGFHKALKKQTLTSL